MTEAEWLTSADPLAMLLPLSGVACTRKWRLFAIESFRHLPHQFNFPLLDEAVALAAAKVDGIAHRSGNVDDELQQTIWNEAENEESPRLPLAHAAQLVLSGYILTIGDGRHAIECFEEALRFAGRAERIVGFRATQAALLREIFGNPFAPNWFRPAWRTDTAVILARQMYESREFGAMPILADALQDAGCEDEQVLMHCRDAGGGLGEPVRGSTIQTGHVRGCWVCDLVLGKV